MVTLAEAAPAMVRRQALPQVAQLTPLVLRTMADLDDDDDWANQDDLAVEDNDRYCRFIIFSFFFEIKLKYVYSSRFFKSL